MIRHQAIAQNAQFVSLRVILQQPEVDLPILVVVERLLTMVAPLGDVMGQADSYHSRDSCHSNELVSQTEYSSREKWKTGSLSPTSGPDFPTPDG